MAAHFTLELTAQELNLLRNTIRARRIYEPCQHTLARGIWQPWMEPLLEKLSQAEAH
ncbi:MAG: hypothetical protein RLZZ11_97 [Cyanobacteriota bacterium]